MNFGEVMLKKNKSSVFFNSNENGNLMTYLNNIPLNNLKNYYDLETSFFMKNCEKLNFDFFTKIEQINFIPNNYNNLFIILLKEICLLIEEIERLNLQLREKTFSKEENFNSPKKKIYPNKLNYIINVNTNNKLKIKSSKTFKENFEHKKIIEKNNNFSNNNFSNNNNNNNNNNNLNLDLVNKGLEKCQKELENLQTLENLILTNFHNNNNNNNKNKNNLNFKIN
jgi:hypothetical protein